MHRTLIFAVAAGVALMPAVVGLAGNPSFSHRLPVQAPVGAPAVQEVGDDELRVVDATPTGRGGVPTSDGPEDGSGKDGHSGTGPASEPGDDKTGSAARGGGATGASTVDDHGGSRKATSSKGGSGGSGGASKGGSGGHGGNDGSGHH
jgi:hypothetical protein